MLTDKTINETLEFFSEVENVYHHETKKYTMHQLTANILLIKNELLEIEKYADTKVNTAILHEYLQKLQNEYSVIEELANQLDEKFSLFIMGSGKNGKSTLINALLGQKKAAVNILPKTWKIDIYSQALDSEKNPNVKIRYRNNQIRNLPIKEAEELIQSEENKRNESEKRIAKIINDFKEQNATVEQLEQKKRQLNKYELYKSEITEVIWPVVGSSILNDYRLVDTPGLKQELVSDMIISDASEYYKKADGVIWILPANKIAGKTDYKEIDKIISSKKFNITNIIAVINKIDMVAGKEKEILEEAKKLYGKFFNIFIPISASMALKAQLQLSNTDNNNEKYSEAIKLLEDSGLPNLLNHLKSTVFANALDVQLQSKLNNINQIYEAVQEIIRNYFDVLYSAINKYDNIEKQWNEELLDSKNALTENLERFIMRESQRIYSTTSSIEDQLWEMEGEKRSEYIKNNIIRPEYIKRNLESIIIHHGSQLKNLQTSYIEHILSTFTEFPDLNTKELMIFGNTNNITAAYDSILTGENEAQILLGGALALGATALLGPVGVILAGIAATDTGKSIAKWLTRTFGESIATKTKNNFLSSMSRVKDNIFGEYDKAIENSNIVVRNTMDKSFSMLYGSYYNQNKIIEQFNKISTLSYNNIDSLSVEDILFN